jgi:hypothetical protein
MQRTYYGPGSLKVEAASVRKVVVERTHLIGEHQAFRIGKPPQTGEPISLSRAPALAFSNEAKGVAPASDAAWALV